MIVPYILKKLYPDHKELIDNRIKWFQEGISLVPYAAGIYGIYSYMQNDMETVIKMPYFIVFHCFVDMFFCRYELMVHHAIIFTMFYAWTISESQEQGRTIEIITLMSTEMSTIFISIRNILLCEELKEYRKYSLHGTLVGVNDLLFAGVFFYTRIYLYSKNIIFNTEVLHFYNSVMAYGVFYFLYVLNIYWFAIILKKGFKALKHIQFSSLTVEKALQYTCYGYFLLSFVFYYPYNNWNYAFDLFGQLALGYSSYKYHKAITNKLESTYPNIQFDNLDDSVFSHYKFDVFTILMRNSMNVFTHYDILTVDPEKLYYTNELLQVDRQTLCLYFFVAHLIFAGLSVGYLQYLKSSGIAFPYTENHGPKYIIITSLASLPIVISIITGILNTVNLDYKLGVWYFLFLYIMMLVRLMNIGYGLNHFLFHFAYYSMQYTAVQSNKMLLK